MSNIRKKHIHVLVIGSMSAMTLGSMMVNTPLHTHIVEVTEQKEPINPPPNRKPIPIKPLAILEEPFIWDETTTRSKRYNRRNKYPRGR
jgi:hypothetical protein